MGQYTVQPGDSWARIAGNTYGNQRWLVELARANGGTSRVLHPGETIDLPDFDTSISPTISQGDWNDITGANNFGGNGGGGGGNGGYPTPRVGSGPGASTASSRNATSQINPYPTPRMGANPHGVGVTASPLVQPTPRAGSTRTGQINSQRQLTAQQQRQGENYNAMAAAYNKPAGSNFNMDAYRASERMTGPAPVQQPDIWRTSRNLYSGRAGVSGSNSLTPIPGQMGPGQSWDITRQVNAAMQNPATTPPRNPNWNPANNRRNSHVQTVLDNRTVSYGTEGSPLTQAQFNRGAQYTGEAFQNFLTTSNRQQLPRFMTTDLANVMPFPKRAGVTPTDWLKGMGYEEFRPGVWRILDPVSKYGGGRGYAGGGGGYSRGGGGGGRYGGGGGGGYYNQARNLGLVNWRIGIG